MARFIYSAHGIGIAGRITRPIDCPLEPKGVCVLPPGGGKVSSRDGSFTLSDPVSGEFLLSYASAETSIEGVEITPGTFQTVLISKVRKINVGNVLKADEVIAKFTLKYDQQADRTTISTEGSAYVNLTVAGEAFNVTLDNALGQEAADYEAFKKNHPELPERRGKVWYALGRHPKLQFDEYDYGYYKHPNFGRIYFGEWTAAPSTQELTMLRLQLGSPQEGDLWIGGGRPNGSGYP